jgi:hypothetical protein
MERQKPRKTRDELERLIIDRVAGAACCTLTHIVIHPSPAGSAPNWEVLVARTDDSLACQECQSQIEVVAHRLQTVFDLAESDRRV